MTQLAENTAAEAIATTVVIAGITLSLAAGEIYGGHLLGDEGGAGYHVILLPGDVSKTWKKAMEWAASVGGDLPTPAEQCLLRANRPDEFKRDYYWSNKQSESDSGGAWGQGFGNGSQVTCRKSYEFRARAVRRVAAQ